MAKTQFYFEPRLGITSFVSGCVGVVFANVSKAFRDVCERVFHSASLSTIHQQQVSTSAAILFLFLGITVDDDPLAAFFYFGYMEFSKGFYRKDPLRRGSGPKR